MGRVSLQASTHCFSGTILYYKNRRPIPSVLLHTDPTWDSSPIRMPGWFALLLKDIPKQNAAFDALLRFGYVASSKGVACFSGEAGHRLEMTNWATVFMPAAAMPSGYSGMDEVLGAGGIFNAIFAR